MIVELPTRTIQQLREFKRRTDTLYQDYHYTITHTQVIASSEQAESMGPVMELLRQLSGIFTESEEPAELIPEIAKIVSETFVPNIITFLECIEECWVGLQAAIGLNDEVGADVALEVCSVKLLDSLLAEKIQNDIDQLKRLGL